MSLDLEFSMFSIIRIANTDLLPPSIVQQPLPYPSSPTRSTAPPSMTCLRILKYLPPFRNIPSNPITTPLNSSLNVSPTRQPDDHDRFETVINILSIFKFSEMKVTESHESHYGVGVEGGWDEMRWILRSTSMPFCSGEWRPINSLYIDM